MAEENASQIENEQLDYLLECLVLLTQYYKRPYSSAALRSGLPIVNESFTPQMFVRAAERVGFKARQVKRSLKNISPLVLPAVLLLKGDKACILNAINKDKTIGVTFPELGNEITTKTLDELEEQYEGYALFIQPTYRFTDTEEKAPSSSWFWGTLLHYRYAYVKVLLAALLINIFALLGPLYIMNVYDRVVTNRVMVTLWVLSIGIVVVYIFDFVLRFLRAYVVDVVGKKSDILMADYLFEKVLNLQLANKPESVGYFASNLREFEVLRDFFTSATLVSLIDFPFIILYLFFIGYIGGYIVLVPLILIPVMTILTLWANRPLKHMIDDVVKHSSQRHAVLIETVSGLEIIKSLVAEALMQRKWEKHVGEGARISLKARFTSSLVSNISLLIQQILTVGIVVVGVYEIINTELTLGGLIACSILGGRIMAPISQLVGMMTRFDQAKHALEGLNKLMALPTERSARQQFLQLPGIRGEIEFKNVSFSYPHQKAKALDDVTFKVAAGEHIAILGRVGSGKSTIQKLILGLYRPEKGAVYIDNVDSNQLDPIDVRRSVGYVPQETMLFAGTVRDNILMGKPGADDAAVIQAAQISGAERFIKEHPHGYHWTVGDRGEGLSGGQRQSIAIARALISNAPILLLDEPTSAVDDSSEQELIQRLAVFTQNKTFILVTHRVPLLRLVTRIIVMANGKIVIDGPRDEILQKLQAPPTTSQVNRT